MPRTKKYVPDHIGRYKVEMRSDGGRKYTITTTASDMIAAIQVV